MKRQNEKRKKLDEMYKKAIPIKCCYCDARNGCKNRVSKEKSEAYGFATYCCNTPNRPRKTKFKRKKTS